jgi:hypothetical protein
VYNFTAATKGEFGWVSANEGGFFTRALTNFLCTPRDQIRYDSQDGFVGWDDFFRRVRDTTLDFFKQAKAASPADAEIRKSESQIPEAFQLGGWPTQYRRQLVLKNDSGRKLCVWVQYYDLNFTTNEWEWYYPTKNAMRYEIEPGAVMRLRHNDWIIGANRVRIWAASLDGQLVWNTYKNQDLFLAKDGYNGPYQQFTFTFNP